MNYNISNNNETLLLGDCLDEMQKLVYNGTIVDMILCDLPYGITQNKWDAIIPLDKLWECYKKLIKPNGCICLFGSEPFTSQLIMSNIKWFKYNWIWQKNRTTGFLNAKKQPMNDHETISVFYDKQCLYNPQMTKAEKLYKREKVRRKNEPNNYGKEKDYIAYETGLRYPKRIIYFNNNFVSKQVHPTQKPVDLCEYLIKTYTNEGDIVLDNCMGSGTTGVACKNIGRKFIGIENNEKYFNIAKERIEV